MKNMYEPYVSNPMLISRNWGQYGLYINRFFEQHKCKLYYGKGMPYFIKVAIRKCN